MSKAVGYVRVSTDKQAESGLSMESQEEKIRAMAVVKDAELVEIIVDAAESAKDLNRPGAQKVLKMVKARAVDLVVVAKLDRLTRSVRDLGELVEVFNRKDVALVSVAETLDTQTAAGRMVLNMIGVVSQWEREVISERTGDALRAKRRRGERAGTVPYGFRVGGEGKLITEPSEADTVAAAAALRAKGLSLRGIADELNKLEFTTRAGTPWRFQYVARILGVK